MKWFRIYAVIVRHMYQWPRDYENLAEAFWWPTIDIVVWGLASTYIAQQNSSQHLIVQFFVGALVLWMFVYRSQQEVGFTFLKEVWDRNFLNLMTTPLTIAEFTTASLLLGAIRLFISAIYMSVLAYIFFSFNIGVYALSLVPWVIILLMTGWAAGFFINGLIIRYGYRIQSFAWTLILAIQPFSAVFYPVSSLPLWMQRIAHVIPPSYAFEGMRKIFITQRGSFDGIQIAFFLNVIYLFLAVMYFNYSFHKSKENGMLVKFG